MYTQVTLRTKHGHRLFDIPLRSWTARVSRCCTTLPCLSQSTVRQYFDAAALREPTFSGIVDCFADGAILTGRYLDLRLRQYTRTHRIQHFLDGMLDTVTL